MIGTTVGRYRIESVLGAGGMGVVYRGYDTELGRPVAIKVLASDGNQDTRRRLLREARSASALNHPHICTVHEVGEAEGRAFLVMELVDGRVLRDMIPAQGLPTDTVIRYGSQIAAALAHAHDHGVIHRDLKTANVVVTETGRAKVLDFGIARRTSGSADSDTESQSSVAGSGAAIGTLAYMAPELLQGATADARSDVWALGVVLYEMATGRPPFQAATPFELVSAILRDPVPRPPACVPAGLASVILRCLAREPGRRYQRASEVESALEPLAGSAGAEAVGSMVERRSPARRWVLTSAGVALAAFALLFGRNVTAVRNLLGASVGASSVRALAVLPLNNLSGDPRQDYFADGMTESLISSLAQIRALKVISRTSAMRYKGTSKSLPEIARELNVDGIIEGSVQYADGRVRVTAQLIHAATDTHLWAREYDRNAADVLKLQSEVARAIADEIRIQLTPQEQSTLARTRSIDPAAYEAYLRGLYEYWRFNESDLKQAIGHFERASQIEPQYAAAYAALSDAWNERGVWGALPFPETNAPQRAAARKALELDDRLSAAHTSWGNVKATRDWDWASAEAEYRRAIELDPGNLQARHLYAVLLMALGRHADAVAEMEHAEAIDPMSSAIQSTFGRVLYRARRYDDAVPHLQRAIDLDPRNFGAYGRLCDVYEQQDRLEEAISMCQQADQLRQGSMAVRYSPALARLFARSGRRREALAMMETIGREPQAVTRATEIASAYAAFGDRDQAFAWLNRGVDARVLMIFVKTEPKLDRLHDDPRWALLLRRLNLTP